MLLIEIKNVTFLMSEVIQISNMNKCVRKYGHKHARLSANVIVYLLTFWFMDETKMIIDIINAKICTWTKNGITIRYFSLENLNGPSLTIK